MKSKRTYSKTQYKCDYRDNFPSPYITFNPDMLDSRKWTLQDLVKLAAKLNVVHNNTRESVIDGLLHWHRHQFNTHQRKCSGSNFSLLEVEMPPSPPKDNEGRYIEPQKGISPTLLSPLKTKPKLNNDGSPISILSSAKKNRNSGFDAFTPTKQTRPDALKSPSNSERKRIKFSIFNGTRIIPPRPSIYREWMKEAGLDPDASPSSLSSSSSSSLSSPQNVKRPSFINSPIASNPNRRLTFEEDDETRALQTIEEHKEVSRQPTVPLITSPVSSRNRNDIAKNPQDFKHQDTANLRRTLTFDEEGSYESTPRPNALTINNASNTPIHSPHNSTLPIGLDRSKLMSVRKSLPMQQQATLTQPQQPIQQHPQSIVSKSSSSAFQSRHSIGAAPPLTANRTFGTSQSNFNNISNTQHGFMSIRSSSKLNMIKTPPLNDSLSKPHLFSQQTRSSIIKSQQPISVRSSLTNLNQPIMTHATTTEDAQVDDEGCVADHELSQSLLDISFEQV